MFAKNAYAFSFEALSFSRRQADRCTCFFSCLHCVEGVFWNCGDATWHMPLILPSNESGSAPSHRSNDGRWMERWLREYLLVEQAQQDSGVGVTCIAVEAQCETTGGWWWRGSLVATGSEKHLTHDWHSIEKICTPPQHLPSRESASQSCWYKHQCHRFWVWKSWSKYF